MLVLLVGPTYMFSTLVWTMSTPHSNLESGIMCLFNRDHISATVGFDEDYKFSADEMALQRIHRATMNGSSTILSALACKLWKQPRLGLQIHLLRRLQDLSPTRGRLLYDLQIDAAEKGRLLKASHYNGVEMKTAPRTIDYLRGTSEALETYYKTDPADLKSAIENWRSTRNETNYTEDIYRGRS